ALDAEVARLNARVVQLIEANNAEVDKRRAAVAVGEERLGRIRELWTLVDARNAEIGRLEAELKEAGERAYIGTLWRDTALARLEIIKATEDAAASTKGSATHGE